MLKAHVTPETLPRKRQTDTNDKCTRSFDNNIHTSSKGTRLSFNDKETVVFRLSGPAFWMFTKDLAQCHNKNLDRPKSQRFVCCTMQNRRRNYAASTGEVKENDTESITRMHPIKELNHTISDERTYA